MALPEGTIIDKYTLGRCIGTGGMGEVYEAHHSLVGKHCAIKILKPEMAAQEQVVTRMLREAQAAAAIGHPNIVDTMDFGSTPNGSYYLVMEFLDGESLGGLMERTGAMPVEPAVRITEQVLSALEAAHAKGIVHRDLKPDNVFIARDRRGNEEVKLLDFGISKFSSANEEAMRLTASGMVLGTPYYMSPEQADGAAHVDGRTDLWAMGVILYEALSGQIPFPGDTYSQVIIQVATREPPPLRTLRPDLSNALEAVINGALAKDPDARWHNATDMLRVLRTACPELTAHEQTLSQSSPSLLSTGSVKALPTATDAPSAPGVVATSDARAITGQEPTTAMDVVLPTPPDTSRTEVDSVPPAVPATSTEPGGPATPTPEAPVSQTVSNGAVAGRESVMWDPGSGKRKIGIGIGVVVALAAVGAVLFFALGPKDKDTPHKGRAAGTGEMSAAATPDATAPQAPQPMGHPATTPGTPRTLSVKLEGLPRRAQVKLDGQTVDVPLTLPADGKEHQLQVSAPRHHTLRQKLVARVGLTSIRVQLRRRRGRDPVMRPEPRPMRPVATTMRPPPRPMQRDSALANPYAMRPRPRAMRPMQRGGVYTAPY